MKGGTGRSRVTLRVQPIARGWQLGVCNGPLDQLTCAGAMGVTTHRGFGPFAVDPEGRGRPPGLGLARGRGRVEGCRSALSTSEPASRPDYLQSPPRGGRGVERWLGFSLHVGDPVPCRRASGRPRVGRPSHAHLGSARRARARPRSSAARARRLSTAPARPPRARGRCRPCCSPWCLGQASESSLARRSGAACARLRHPPPSSPTSRPGPRPRW